MHLPNLSVSHVAQLLVCAVWLTAAGCASPPPPTARVLGLKGAAQWSSDDGAIWQTLKRHQELLSGAIIRTASDSRLDLQFSREANSMTVLPVTSPRDADTHPASPTSRQLRPPATRELLLQPCVIRMWESSILKIEQLPLATESSSSAGEARFDLRVGHVFLRISKKWGSACTVRFPKGVVLFQPGVYDLNFEGRLRVLSGGAVITTDSGKSQRVTSDQQYDVRTGELVPLPDLDRLSMTR